MTGLLTDKKFMAEARAHAKAARAWLRTTGSDWTSATTAAADWLHAGPRTLRWTTTDGGVLLCDGNSVTRGVLISTSTTAADTGITFTPTANTGITFTATANTSEPDPFRQWVQAAEAVANADAWVRWNNQAIARIEVRESAEERRRMTAIRQAEMQRYEAARAAEAAERRIAAARAKRLLIENISPAQRKSLKEKGYFEVEVSGKTYRIKWGSHGNVYLVQGGREVRSFCIQPPDVPEGDAMLAQKLLLETDEASFLRIANARDLRN